MKNVGPEEGTQSRKVQVRQKSKQMRTQSEAKQYKNYPHQL